MIVVPEPLNSNTEEREGLLRLLAAAEQLDGRGSWILDHDSHTLLCSPQLERLLQNRKDQPLAQVPSSLDALLLLAHPDDRALIRDAVRQSIYSGAPFSVEHRLVQRDGTERLLLHRGETVCDERGRALHTLASVEDVSEQRRLEREIAAQVNTDTLTGLPNRAASLQHLQRRIQSTTYNRQIAVICIDLDNFQNINDSFSIKAGNQVLRWTAEHFKHVLGDAAWVARLDSDMFLIILSEGIRCLADALNTARQLIDSLHTAVPLLAPSIPIQLGACAGVSIAPDHGSDANDLIQCASTALTEAKLHGQCQLLAYSTVMSQRIRERLDLSHKLQKAIEREELEVHYQPQWRINGDLFGAEALLRWRPKGYGHISPERFIPIAEQSDLINIIGEWILSESLQQMQAWCADHLPIQRVSVNVSARQLDGQGDRFEQTVAELLKQSGLPPDQLELEITESVLFRDPAAALERMKRLSELGIHLAIDDFGTGFSSLAMLQQMPLNQLKIDRHFVDNMINNSGKSIVKATIMMAHELRLQCIAEGVETQEQLELLRQMGCDNIQGYLLGKPMPADAFQALLKKQQQLNAAAPDRPLSFQSDSTR